MVWKLVVKTWICCALLLPMTALAQYKCIENSRTTYADRPCSAGAKTIILEADERERKRDAEVVREIKRRIAKMEEDERHGEQYRAIVNRENQRLAKCSALLRAAIISKTEAATWEDPNLVYAAEIRKMAAEKAYQVECTAGAIR